MSAASFAKALADTSPPAPHPATNAEKARALIAMLEQGQDAPQGVPPERLRDWASDLIRTVEAGQAGAGRVKVPEPPAPAPTLRRRSLFKTAAPTLTATPTTPPATPPVRATAPVGRLNLTAPMLHDPHGAQIPDATAPKIQAMFNPVNVRKVIDATIDPATIAREHPAVIAMTLMGKPSIEQAASLRSLPGGQVRAVHKALRQLEHAAQTAAQETAPAV